MGTNLLFLSDQLTIATISVSSTHAVEHALTQSTLIFGNLIFYYRKQIANRKLGALPAPN